MERITIPDEKTEGGWKRAVIDPKEVKKYTMTLYWTLKKYEDTGLTPDEIDALRERDMAKVPEKFITDSETKIGAIRFGKGTKIYRCPECGRMLVYQDHYCRNCGQRLKWEDWPCTES